MSYTRPTGSAVNFQLGGAYTRPTGGAVNFSEGGGSLNAGSVALPPLVAIGYGGGICSATLPAVFSSGEMFTPKNEAVCTMPPLRVFALSSPSVLNALSASLQPVHAIGQGGAVAKMGIPPFRIEASATVSGVGRMVGGRLPPMKITAKALVGAVGRATAVALPSMMGGAMLSGGGTTFGPMVLPVFAGGGTGTMGTVGRMAGGVLPAIAGYATARSENYGRMVGGRLPSLIMPKQVIGRGTLPLLSVSAVASAGVGHAWTLEWALLAIESYVMGVDAAGDATAHPVTRYTNYPFLQVIRLGDSYYGVAPNGLHRIGGAHDNGAPIPWAMQTHVTDFGSQFHKTVASAYLGGTIGPSVTFSVLTGEHPEQMHAHTNTFTTQLKNHREKFGKGRKARYWAFGLSSSSTATTSGLMLDALDLEVFEMSRRVI